MENNPLFTKIVDLLKVKSSTKQDVFRQTIEGFHLLRDVTRELSDKLRKEMFNLDKRIIIEFKERGEFDFYIKVAGDLLVFHMHTNVFDFDDGHFIKKSSYVAQNPLHSFCGVINVYNFLADSFKYNRINDLGYLMGRIFINREGHYFAEGKSRSISLSHNNFSEAVFNHEKALEILEQFILSSIEFDLYSPPYETQREISVSEINETSNNFNIQTAKRLGFKFQYENEGDKNPGNF